MSSLKDLATDAIGFGHFMWVMSLDAVQPHLGFLGLDSVPPATQIIAREFVRNELRVNAARKSWQPPDIDYLLSSYWDKLEATVSIELRAKLRGTLKLFVPDQVNGATRAWVGVLRAFAFRSAYPDPPIATDKAAAFKESIRAQLDPSVEVLLFDLESQIRSTWDKEAWHAYSARFTNTPDQPTLANLLVDAVRSRSVQSIFLEPRLAWSAEDCTIVEEWARRHSQRIAHAPSFVKDLPSRLRSSRSRSAK